jgi:cell wall-associated NlpC family hydrolase
MKKIKTIICIILVIAMMSAFMLTTAGAAGTIAYGAGTVSASCLNIRSGPSTSDSVIGTVVRDSRLVILEQTNSVWYKINYNGTEGYVACRYLTEVVTKENFMVIGRLNGTSVRMRSGPSTDYDILGTYNTGTTFTVLGINEGWYKVRANGTTGYIRSDFIDIVSGYTVNSDPTTLSATVSENGQKIVDYALQFEGYPYVYGGADPSGFDCSGFVMYVYDHFGYTLYHGATGLYQRYGTFVDSRDQLQPGDLVFFGTGYDYCSHVGLYIGDGQFIHASTSATGVIISNLYGAWYDEMYVGAKRILE